MDSASINTHTETHAPPTAVMESFFNRQDPPRCSASHLRCAMAALSRRDHALSNRPFKASKASASKRQRLASRRLAESWSERGVL
jgi:hypothetical protein